jgi:two-component system secretion system response regulator SalR
LKVAYVEDDIDARNIFSKKLQSDHISCDTFSSAEDALEHIRAGSHDMLIIDICLPKKSGIQLLKELRKLEIHTPCILITAFNSLEYSREALNSNANYLLEKPFNYQSLRQIIKKIILAPGSLQHCVDRGIAQLNLTAREKEIAVYILKGLSSLEISKLLNISEKTVKHHITEIFEKSRVSSRPEFFSSIFPV